MPSNKRFLGGLIGADPLRSKTGAVAGDSNWNDVVLLLDGSSTSDVTGLSTVTPSASGYTTNNTSGAKFNQYIDFQDSGYFNVAFPSALGVSNEPFTVETWAYFDAISNDGVFQLYPSSFSLDGSAVTHTASIAVAVSSSKWLFYDYGGNNNNLGTSATGNWYHVAVVYDGTALVLYVDGTALKTTTRSMPSGGWTSIGIGGYYTTSFVMDGRIEGFRVTKGVARYSSDFTPPTSALSADVSGITGSDDVTLLLNGESYTDQSSSPLTVVETGGDNAMSLNTTTYKFGSSSYYFGDDTATSENRLYVQDANLAMGTGDFTYECWIYPTHSNDDSIFETRSSGAVGISDGFTLTAITTTSLRVWSGGAARITSGTISNLLNNWHHVAVVRSSGTTTLFINGASQGSTTYSMNCTNNDIIIGMGRYSGSTTIAGGIYGGYIDDIRITKGAALYPFHPPASSFPQQATILGEAYKDPGNVDRVTANAGVLSLDTAGPEDATVTEYTLADYTAYSETQFTASNAEAGDNFGVACDMSGDGTITVFGAPFEDGATNATNSSGAVYVFENGTEVAVLRASDSSASDTFGMDVAISNDGSTIAVGSPQRSSGGTYNTDGAVYVYERPTNGWATTSSEDARLTNTASSNGENLGRSVIISDNGDTIVAARSGAQGGTAPNVVHVYERPTNGWANTSSNVILSATNGQYADAFGAGLAISGDGSVIAIGAPDEDTTQTSSGTVYVYERPTNGWATSTEDHFLGAPTRTFGGEFGVSCSLNEDGTVLAVGEWAYSSTGRVHVLEYSGSSWSHSAILTGSSGYTGTKVDVSRDGTTVAATNPTHNSNEGAVYVWLKPSSGWANSSYHRLITAANGATNDYLGGDTGGSFKYTHGLTLTNDGGKVLASAQDDDDGGTDSGSGFLFAATTTVPGSVSTTTKGSQWFWGGMRGRNAIQTVSGDANLVDTGVISLSEYYQTNIVPPTPPDGLSSATAGDSAAQILADYPSSTDGIYYIKDGAGTKQVYCDMTNGGWMLYTSFATNSTYDATTYPAWNGNRIGAADMRGGSPQYGWTDDSENGRDGTTTWGTGSGETQHNGNDGPVYMLWNYSGAEAYKGVEMTQWNGPSFITQLRVGWGKGASSYSAANLANHLLVNNTNTANSPKTSQSDIIENVSFNPTGSTPLLLCYERDGTHTITLGINGISSVWMK